MKTTPDRLLPLLLLLCFGVAAGPHLKSAGAGEDQEAQPPASQSPLAPNTGLDEFLKLALTPPNDWKGSQGEPLPNADFLIATIADPLSTRFGAFFDEAIDAISSSAVQSNYLLERYWLPWKPRAASCKEECDAPDAANGGPNHSPGALVFRHSKKQRHLVVFLVGESPVRGVDGPALRAALKRSAFPAQKAYVLGPSFSGSARSLWEGLAETRGACESRPWGEEVQQAGLRNCCSARVVTGSATASNLGEPQWVDLARTVVPDDEMVEFVHGYLKRPPQGPLPHREARIAMLIESGTVYASQIGARSEQDQAVFRFPMHIAQLRAAHDQSGGSDKAASMPELRRTLRFRGDADPRADSDVVPVLSGLTPFDAELTLRSTLREIARNDYDYLIIAATDPIDTVYLAREARAFCPNARLVTFGAHLLYAHPDLRSEMDGMLIGSSYPLFVENQAWALPIPGGQRLIKSFVNESAEGIYNAMLWLLHDLRTARDDNDPAQLSRHDWQATIGRDARLAPAMWLSTVDSGQLWPILHSPTKSGPIAPPDQVSAISLDWKVRPSQAFMVLTVLLVVAAAIQLAVELGLLSVPWLSFAGMQAPLLRRLCLYRGVASSTLGLMAGLVGVSLADARAPTIWECGFAWTGIGFGSLLILLGLLWFMRLNDACRDSRERFCKIKGAFSWFVFGATLLFALAWCTQIPPQGDERRAFLVMRLLDPAGMCPLLPILLSAFALYVWSIYGLVRVTGLNSFPDSHPFSQNVGRDFQVDLHHSSELHPDEHRWAPSVVAAWALAFAIAWYCWLKLTPSDEGPVYDGFAKILAIGVFFAVTLSAVECTTRWHRLRVLMRKLVATPLAEAYSRMGEKVAGSFGLELRSKVPEVDELVLAPRAYELLVALAEPKEPAAVPTDPTSLFISHKREQLQRDAEALRSVFAKPEKSVEPRTWSSKWRAGWRALLEPSTAPNRPLTIHTQLYEKAAQLSTVLEQLWQLRTRHPDSKLLDELGTVDKLLPTGELASVPTLMLAAGALDPHNRLWIRAAEDFVAMRHTTYIYHVINQIRLNMTSALLGAVLLAQALLSYPFHPRRFALLAGSVVVLGVAACAVVVIVGMERSELLVRLERGKAGGFRLDFTFISQLVTYVLVPGAILAARAFPELADGLSSWVEALSTLLR